MAAPRLLAKNGLVRSHQKIVRVIDPHQVKRKTPADLASEDFRLKNIIFDLRKAGWVIFREGDLHRVGTKRMDEHGIRALHKRGLQYGRVVDTRLSGTPEESESIISRKVGGGGR